MISFDNGPGTCVIIFGLYVCVWESMSVQLEV